MRKVLIILLISTTCLFAGPQYTDIKHSILTVDFSKLSSKTISIDGSSGDWTGILPAGVNSGHYNLNEYIWYDASEDDVGDGDYQYPYNSDFGADSIDIQQVRICHDSSNIYLYIKSYNAVNNVFRSAVVIGIDTDSSETGDYDLTEGDGKDAQIGCSAELRSTSVKCDYTIFSKLENNLNAWQAESSMIVNTTVHSGSYALKMDITGAGSGGGTVAVKPQDTEYVDLFSATNMHLWVYDTQGDNTFKLKLKDKDGAYEEYWSDPYAVPTHSTQNKWKKISFPLSNYKIVDKKNIERLEIYEFNNTGGIYYFDDFTYDQNIFQTFETPQADLWTSSGQHNQVFCQPEGTKEWEIAVPKSIVGDPLNGKWNFIVGTGFHENDMMREVQPPNSGALLEWWGIGGDSLWWSNTSPDPDVFDLAGADLVQQKEDLAGYEEIFSEDQENFESLNVGIKPKLFNPEKESSVVYCSVPVETSLTIRVLSIKGREIKKLYDNTVVPPEAHDLFELNYNGKDADGEMLRSGVYILYVRFKNSSRTRDVYKYFKIWR